MKKSEFMTKITKKLDKANYYDLNYQFDINTDNKTIKAVVIARKNGHEYRLVTMNFYDDKFDYKYDQ